MSEEDILNDLFCDNKKWKNKYKVRWCDLCTTAILVCPACKNTTCNCGGCKECHDDFDEFNKNTKHRIESYLTDDEVKVYRKTIQIRKHILETLRENLNEIDWTELERNGKLSQIEMEMFIDKK
jgi:hypothetical protein